MGNEGLKLYCGINRIFDVSGNVSPPWLEFTVAANEKEAREEFERAKYSSDFSGGRIRKVDIEKVTLSERTGYRIRLERIVKGKR